MAFVNLPGTLFINSAQPLVSGGMFAKIAKSNVAVERLFFGLRVDPLLLNDCPIPIFSGLGGHGLCFSSLGQ